MRQLAKIFLSFTRNERIVFLVAVGAAVLSLAVIAGSFIGRSTQLVPAEGGSYVLGMAGQPIYVNPVLASSTDKFLVPLLFANLPDLADRIEMDKDGKTWRVHLKEGLTWSDGVKLTSDDVIFTLGAIQDPASRSDLAPSWQGVTAERGSELEIRFKLSAPYPFFSENLDHLYVVPKHLFGETPPANWRFSEYNLKPIGSGPYVFESAEMRPDGFLAAYHLRSSKNYAGPKPFIRSLTVRFFPNPDSLVKAFNAGQIDGFGSLDPEMARGVNRSYQSFPFALPSYYAAFLNQSQNQILADPLVRKALSDSVDRKYLARDVFGGQAQPVDMPGPGAVQNASSSEELAQALSKAGWLPGEDGVRAKTEKKSSVPLRFILTVPQVPFLLATAQRLQADWAKIGIRAELKELSVSDAFRSISNRDYQALLYGNIVSPPGDLYSFWHSSQRFYPGLNLALYSSRKADQLLEAMRRELDPVKRGDELATLELTISSDHPAVFLYSPAFLFVSRKGLWGVDPKNISEPSDLLRQIPAWYVRTARSFK